MREVTTYFKPRYYAGETAKIAIRATEATAVRLVYGANEIPLAQDGDTWSATVSTASLVGAVRWAVFVTEADGTTEAFAHGVFKVLCAGRSPLREVIEKIDEAVRTWGTNPNRSLTVGELSITYKSLNELLAVRAQYVQMAEEQETGAAASGGVRIVEVAF